jgi:small GTP-binding protein
MNIANQLTPPGVSAIAVIRLSGPGVPGFLQQHFNRPVRPGRCVHGNLTGPDGVIDDPVIAWVAEDAVDVNLHGGTAVVRTVLDLAGSCGFEINPPAPVPADLQAEVIAALPLARTETALRALLAQPAAWKNFTPAIARNMLDDPSGRWLIRPPTVAIVGPANVGKSTLANRLYGQDRAIVADMPGTTRDWVGAVADLNGLAVTLVDTPGLRTTDDAIEIAAVAAAAGEIRAADLVVVVVDTSVRETANARSVLKNHRGAIVVANKSDRAAVWSVPGAIAVSAFTGNGIGQLMSEIRRRFGWEPVDIERSRWWTDRQRAILLKNQSPGCSQPG